MRHLDTIIDQQDYFFFLKKAYFTSILANIFNVIGSGGTMVELSEDTVTLLLPTNKD